MPVPGGTLCRNEGGLFRQRGRGPSTNHVCSFTAKEINFFMGARGFVIWCTGGATRRVNYVSRSRPAAHCDLGLGLTRFVFVLQTREKLEPCQQSAVPVNQDPTSLRTDSSSRVLPPSDSEPRAVSPSSRDNQSEPAISLPPSSVTSQTPLVVTSSADSPQRAPVSSVIFSLPAAWGALYPEHVHRPLPYQPEDVEKNELLSVSRLSSWDYPVFELASQAPTTILSQVSGNIDAYPMDLPSGSENVKLNPPSWIGPSNTNWWDASHAPSVSVCLSLTLTLVSLSVSLPPSLSISFPLCHSLPLSLFHTHTHTHTPTLSLGRPCCCTKVSCSVCP